MRQHICIAIPALALVTLLGFAGAAAAGHGGATGGGSLDGWVDAHGDSMYGTLVMESNVSVGSNAVVFDDGALQGSGGSGLFFDGQRVCVADQDISGCGNEGDISAVRAESGLDGGGTSGEVALSMNTSETQARVTGTCPSKAAIQAIAQTGSVTCEGNADLLDGLDSTGFWKLGGNSGPTSADYLGTTDLSNLTIKVDGARSLVVAPRDGRTPVIVGGDSTNVVPSAAEGATVGGGGTDELIVDSAWGGGSSFGPKPNNATEDFATVGGGAGNTAGDSDSAPESAFFATVSGGRHNTASGAYATIGGGFDNNALDSYATIPGGRNNEASGRYSMAAGAGATASHEGSFVWSDGSSTVSDSFESTGRHQFLIEAAGGVGIGTANPSWALDVAGKALVSSDVRMPQSGLCVDADGACVPPADGEVTAVAYNTGHSDVAEVYRSDDQLRPAEVVTLDEDEPGQFERTTRAAQAGPLRVVSSDPGLLLGAPTGEQLKAADIDPEAGPTFGGTQVLPGTYPIALSGRVPVQVTTENGPVSVGDPLTSSTVPGVAMKATDGAPTIGEALESYRGTGVGTIQVFVAPGAQDPASEAGVSESSPDVSSPDKVSRLQERVQELERENQQLRENLTALQDQMHQLTQTVEDLQRKHDGSQTGE